MVSLAPAGIGSCRYRRFAGSCASDDAPSVSNSFAPDGMYVIWLSIRIVYVCVPECVGTPPAETTIVLPAFVFAERTTTSRLQPPWAVAFTLTVGLPNTSAALRVWSGGA